MNYLTLAACAVVVALLLMMSFNASAVVGEASFQAGCHAPQFANPAGDMCLICHTDAQSGTFRSFPPLRSFNVKFDHARQSQREASVGGDDFSAYKRCHKGSAWRF